MLYIGISINAWQRFAQHRRKSVFYHDATRIELQRGFTTRDELEAAEITAIKNENPRHNITHNGSHTVFDAEPQLLRRIHRRLQFEETHRKAITKGWIEPGGRACAIAHPGQPCPHQTLIAPRKSPAQNRTAHQLALFVLPDANAAQQLRNSG